MPGLKGKMKNIDVAKPFGKITGADFAALRAMKQGNGKGKMGEVLNDKLEIACDNNQSIKILEIQRQGKKSQKIEEFLPGSQIKKGSIISNV